jgi:hypothetical protein
MQLPQLKKQAAETLAACGAQNAEEHIKREPQNLAKQLPHYGIVRSRLAFIV